MGFDPSASRPCSGQDAMFVNEVDFVLRARVTLLPFHEQTMDGISHRQQDIQGSTWTPLMAKNRSSIRNGSLNFTSPTPEFIPPLKTRAVGKKNLRRFQCPECPECPRPIYFAGAWTENFIWMGCPILFHQTSGLAGLDVDQETGG